MRALNPRIVRTVAWLNGLGFDTCDSGDGKTGDFACDRTGAYVVVQCSAAELVRQADRLLSEARRYAEVAPVATGEIYIQANYDPANNLAFIELFGFEDSRLEGG